MQWLVGPATVSRPRCFHAPFCVKLSALRVEVVVWYQICCLDMGGLLISHKVYVALALQVYASRIAELESQVLLDKRPPARLTKELHLLGNDLKGVHQFWTVQLICASSASSMGHICP